jgi:hypothetical protein
MLGSWNRRIIPAGAILLLALILPSTQACAETVIYYSPTENAYGWCAGYSYNRAHSCARNYCADQNATDCQLALECADGWGAVAFADNPAVGVGMSCGLNKSSFAQSIALANCMAVSNTMCWTDVTFDGSGDTSSAESNREFDITWYSQAMLQLSNYDPGTADGNIGRQTRSAIEEFQVDLGRSATGTLDDELFLRLLDAAGGAQHFSELLKRDVVEPEKSDLSQNMYGYSAAPLAKTSFSEELMTRSEDQRLIALAVQLATSNTPCALPALSAEAVPDATSGIWDIECMEGSYTLILNDDGSTIVTTNSAPEEASPSPKTQPEPSKKVQP